MSLAMRRARRIYFWPNVRGWAVIGALVSAVYFYSIEAVAQDDFVRSDALCSSPLLELDSYRTSAASVFSLD